MKEQKSNNKKIKTKKEKGITLIALIIIIVVLLILAVVSIGSIRESKIMEHAENAKNTYKEEQIKEEVELFNAEYLLTTQRNMQEKTKERMIEICKEIGVKPEQLAVYYDVYNANENKKNINTENYVKSTEEFVLYRLDKTTAEEQAILEQNEVLPLRGDIDMDGYLTENDGYIINAYDAGVIDDDFFENFDFQIKIMGDVNGDEWADGDDSAYILQTLAGIRTYSGGWMAPYLK